MLCTQCVVAQTITPDTCFATIGNECVVRLAVQRAQTRALSFSAQMHISNPTVFYPYALVVRAASALDTIQVTRLTDSTYSLAFTTSNVQSQSLELLLHGEALAGNDSTCQLTFSNCVVDSTPTPNVVAHIRSTSIGTSLPYVRFATLEAGYPVPARVGRAVTWAYRIDKESDVTFEIYNPQGRRLFIQTISQQVKGTHLFSFQSDYNYFNGAYYLRMTTNSGTLFQHFVLSE